MDAFVSMRRFFGTKEHSTHEEKVLFATAVMLATVGVNCAAAISGATRMVTSCFDPGIILICAGFRD